MKNTDIAKIRQLLKAMVKISNTEPRNAADVVYGDLALKALALLPCETCGGTGKVQKILGQINGMPLRDCIGDKISCPDCQS